MNLTPGQRMRAILNYSPPEIIPVPDFQFHRHGNDVYVECTERHADHIVIDAVQKKYGGHWLLRIWCNVINGERVFQSNPHVNGRGYWIWKIVKA